MMNEYQLYITDNRDGFGLATKLSGSVPITHCCTSIITYKKPEAFAVENGWLGSGEQAKQKSRALLQVTAQMTFPVVLVRTNSPQLEEKLLKNNYIRV